MPKPPLLGEVARRSRDGEVVQSSTCVLRSLERRPLFNLSDACGDSRSPFGTCVPPPPAGGGGTQVPKGDSGIERSEDDGEVSPPQKQIPHTGRLRCGGAGMESGNVFNCFCHRRQRCGSCHRRCRCTAPDRGRCAPRPPHRWGRGLQWQKPCSGSRCRPCR